MSDVEKNYHSLNSPVKLFLKKKSEQNGGEITRKLRAWAAPGQTKTTIARKLLLRLELNLVVSN